jgi:hypothetical protein
VAEIESLDNRKVIEKVVSLTIPGLDAERHLVCMQAAPAGS